MTAIECSRVFHLHQQLLGIYEPSDAVTWLMTPLSALGAKRPCEAISTTEGYDTVAALIRQITDGAYT